MRQESKASPVTILVVDDNEANRNLARSTLEDEGHRVVVADGGAAGVAAFEREHPDCILLDVRMPGVDGFEAAKRIRALPGGSETPILFLTALRDVDTFDRAMLAGADDFLTKPVRPTELVVRTHGALKLRQMSVELREHYDLLKHQRDDLLRLQLQKERLMAFVVHDLKNPVNSMDLHAQVLLRASGLPEGARASVVQIRSEARNLSRMILNLLDLSKGDEGKLVARRTRIALPELIGEVLEELALNAAARDVRLQTLFEAESISADADLLRRTLTNLVENAIRYAPSGTAIRIATRQLVSTVEFRVADEGAGISMEKREKVFDAFLQLDEGEPAMARGGRGLGLAFCKVAVEAHGGRIWVEDAAPGAAFLLSLPTDA
jgi:two-component system, sensor histidine kinase and response regulator